MKRRKSCRIGFVNFRIISSSVDESLTKTAKFIRKHPFDEGELDLQNMKGSGRVAYGQT